MKKIFTLLLILVAFTSVFAQKNVVKLNLPSLAFGRISAEYERVLIPKVSATIGLNFMIPSNTVNMPGLNSVDFGDAGVTFKGGAQTLEVRIYPGITKETPRGFYLAPYLRRGSNVLDIPSYSIDYTTNDPILGTPIAASATLDSKFSIIEFGYGLQLGKQWLIGDKVSVDWFFLGPRISTLKFKFDLEASADVNGAEAINMEDVGDALGEQYDTLEGVELTTTANTLQLSAKAPWFGFRTGLKVGIAL